MASSEVYCNHCKVVYKSKRTYANHTKRPCELQTKCPECSVGVKESKIKMHLSKSCRSRKALYQTIMTRAKLFESLDPVAMFKKTNSDILAASENRFPPGVTAVVNQMKKKLKELAGKRSLITLVAQKGLTGDKYLCLCGHMLRKNFSHSRCSGKLYLEKIAIGFLPENEGMFGYVDGGSAIAISKVGNTTMYDLFATNILSKISWAQQTTIPPNNNSEEDEGSSSSNSDNDSGDISESEVDEEGGDVGEGNDSDEEEGEYDVYDSETGMIVKRRKLS
jgi:hypothetical protein